MSVFALALALAFLPGATVVTGMSPIDWWRLAKVVDERTLVLRSETGQIETITLACIGRAKDSREAVAYITRRLQDHKVTFWPLETTHTNWYARPMCVILDMDLAGRGGDAVYDFPLLNEELLIWGRAPFEDVKVTGDAYGLKARLVKAKNEASIRWKEKEGKLRKPRGQN